MPPRSPTQAFDPTPALEHHPDNFSPLNNEVEDEDDQEDMAAMVEDKPHFKEVHFSQSPPIPILTRHSIATTHVPLLPAVSSASHIPKQAFRAGPPGIDMTAYIENCRNLNEQLRQAHETERKAWNIERTAFQARIADLEFRLNKSRDTKRRSSNDSSSTSASSFRSDFRNLHDTTKLQTGRSLSTGAVSQPSSAQPIWRGPESTPPVTRVFSNDDSDVNHLPSISEDAETFPNLSKQVSPTTREHHPSVDVSQLDHTLDGITLRSTGPGLTSSFTTKITSPQFGSPTQSPSPRARNRPPSNTLVNGPINPSLDVNNLLDPLDKKLRLHAGHTPMALDGVVLSPETITEQPTPRADHPPEPAPTKRPPLRPAEDSDSYFSLSNDIPQIKKPSETSIEEEWEADEKPHCEPNDDPALKGPLMLDSSANTLAANAFLNSVDAKLSEVAAHSRLRSDTSTTTDSEPPPLLEAVAEDKTEMPVQNHIKNKESIDGIPKLRIRKSTNFGSAWGGDMPGRNL